MIAVVVVQIVTVPTGSWRSIDRDRCYRPLSTSRSLVHSADTCAGPGFRDSLCLLFANKNSYAEERRELVRGRTFSRYEQFETSPETIEQELRPVVCEQRKTDLRRIIAYILFIAFISYIIRIISNYLYFTIDISAASKL